jgi:hypothetical protein
MKPLYRAGMRCRGRNLTGGAGEETIALAVVKTAAARKPEVSEEGRKLMRGAPDRHLIDSDVRRREDPEVQRIRKGQEGSFETNTVASATGSRL